MQAQFLQMSTADQEDYTCKNSYMCDRIFRKSRPNSPRANNFSIFFLFILAYLHFRIS